MLPQAVPPNPFVVAAHPDDEVIGAASVLMRHRRTVSIVHVTDGAPAAADDARAAGFTSRAAYAFTRRAELVAALSYAGIDGSACRSFAVTDQQASFEAELLARRLARLWIDAPPGCVITHPYEGGHPDHDATALAVHAAVRLLRDSGRPAPPIVEMTSYHMGRRGIETGVFLGGNAGATQVRLDAHERVVKRAMLRCYASQRRTLRYFGLQCERFRAAPSYRFTDPPHAGRLFYECFAWGLDGAAWRAHAARTLAALHLDPATCL